MGKRYRHSNDTEDLNIWPSFTDLMSNAFMILSLFLLLVLFKSLFLKYTSDQTQVSLNQTENQVEELERQLKGLQRLLQGRDRRISVLESKLGEKDALAENFKTQVGELSAQVSSLTSEVNQLKSAPPVVVIENSGEYQFTSGSADLPTALKDYIKNELVDRIEQITNARGIYVVEIIGHTDGQVNFNGVSNLDENLEDVALGTKSINQLKPGSNADLGLMRALEVVKQLQEIQQQEERLRGLEFRAYSAAQLLLPSGEFATTQRQPDAQRRRIEIRFSPLGKAETIR